MGAFCSTPGKRPGIPVQLRGSPGFHGASLHNAPLEVLTPAFISGQFAGIRLGCWHIWFWRWQIRNRVEVESAFPLIWGRNKQPQHKKSAGKTRGRKAKRQTAQKPAPVSWLEVHREADSVTRVPGSLTDPGLQNKAKRPELE